MNLSKISRLRLESMLVQLIARIGPDQKQLDDLIDFYKEHINANLWDCKRNMTNYDYYLLTEAQSFDLNIEETKDGYEIS